MLFIMLVFVPGIFPLEDSLTTASRPLAEYIREGKTLFNRHFYPDAQKVFKEALRLYPEDWRLNWYYIRLIEKIPDRDGREGLPQVLSYYENRVKENPQSAVAYAGLAYGYKALYKKSLAREMADKALEIGKDSLAALHIDAIIKQAFPEFATMDTKGETPPELFGLPGGIKPASAYPKTDKASEAYELLLAKYPDFFEGYQDYFGHYMIPEDENSNLGREMLKKYERALLCPDLDPILYEYKWYFLDKALRLDPQSHIQICEKIIAQDPSHAEIKHQLAILQLNSGNTGRALDLLKESISEAPHYLLPFATLARIYSERQQYDHANEILKPLVQAKTPLEDGEFSRDYYQYLYAVNLCRSGKFDEAAGFLDQGIRESKEAPTYQMEDLLKSIKSRKPEARVKILENVPFIIQKGDYCGPASVAMILQYWGMKLSQDQVAQGVYDKGIGTLTTTTERYLHNLGFRTRVFVGSEEAWKKLLDQGIPILVSKMAGEKNAHAVVIMGYDDFTREFLVHDPNMPFFNTVMYSPPGSARNYFIENQVLDCVLIIPEGKYSGYDLGFIRSSFKMKIQNFNSYLVVGSALRAGFLEGLLIHACFVFVLLFLSFLALRKIIYPYSPRKLLKFLLFCFLFEILINVGAYIYNTEQTAAVLMVYHMGLSLFCLVSLYLRFVHLLIGQYMPLVFFLRTLVVMLAMASIEYLSRDKNLFAKNISLISVIIGICIIFLPLFLIVFIRFFLEKKRYSGAHKLLYFFRLRKKKGGSYFEGLWLESVIFLNRGDYEKALDILQDLLKFPYLTRQHKFRIRMQIAEILLLEIRGDMGERERLLTEAGQIMDGFDPKKLCVLNRAVFYTFRARILLLKGEHGNARIFVEQAENILKCKRGRIKIQDVLEKIRAQGGFYLKYLRLLHNLNRLALARYFGDEAIVLEIYDQYKDRFDLDFMRNRDMYHLLKNPPPNENS